MAFDHRPLYIQCRLGVGFWNGTVPPSTIYGPINFTKAETTPIKQESDDITANFPPFVGEILDSVNKSTEAGTLSLEFNSMPRRLLELVIGADSAVLSQTSSVITDEVVDIGLNMWAMLGHRYISTSAITLKTSAGATVPADKYTIDPTDGLIMALDPAAAGTGMKVSYTTEAVTGEIYEGGKSKSAYVMLRGAAYDKRSEQWGRLTIAKANLSNSSAFDWVKGSWASGALTGKMITPSGYTAPMTFEIRQPA